MIGNRRLLGAAVAAVLVSSLGALAGCASEEKQEPALTGKQVQAASVTLTVHDVNGTQVGQGAGILIAPRLVLTSAHLVAGKSRWSVTSADGTVKSAGIRGMTYDWMDYDNSQKAHPRKHDVAVVYLDKPINLDTYPKISGEKLANGAQGTRLRSNGSAILQLPQTFKKVVGFPHAYLTDMDSKESVEPGGAVLNEHNEIVGVVTGRGLTTGQMYVARTNDLTDWLSPKAQCGGRKNASVRTYGTPPPKPGCDTPGNGSTSGTPGTSSGGSSGASSSGASSGSTSGSSGESSSGSSGASSSGTSGSSGQSSGTSGSSGESSSGASSSGGTDNPSCHDGGGHCHGNCHGVPNDGSSSGSSGTSGQSSGSSGESSSGASSGSTSGSSGESSSSGGSSSGASGTSGQTSSSSGSSGETTSGSTSGASGQASSGASGSTSGTSGTSGQSSGSSGESSSGASSGSTSGASGNTSSSGGAGTDNNGDGEVCEGSGDNPETCPPEADGCSGGNCGGAYAPDGLIDYGGCSSCSNSGDDDPLVVR